MTLLTNACRIQRQSSFVSISTISHYNSLDSSTWKQIFTARAMDVILRESSPSSPSSPSKPYHENASRRIRDMLSPTHLSFLHISPSALWASLTTASLTTSHVYDRCSHFFLLYHNHFEIKVSVPQMPLSIMRSCSILAVAAHLVALASAASTSDSTLCGQFDKYITSNNLYTCKFYGNHGQKICGFSSASSQYRSMGWRWLRRPVRHGTFLSLTRHDADTKVR